MGEVIKTHRIALGLSQQELGNRVGVNKAAVQKWESGAVENIKRSVIKELSVIFDISPAELLGWGDRWNESNIKMNGGSNISNNGVIGTVNGEVSLAHSNDSLSVQEQDLLRIFRNADGKQQLKIMQLVYSIEGENGKDV